MGMTDGKILYCHGVTEGNVDRNISTLEHNNRTVYDFFNNPFTYDFGSPALNLPPITFDDRPRPHKWSQYTPDLLPDDISVASENYFNTFTTPYDLPYLLLYDGPNTLHGTNMDVSVRVNVHRVNCCMKQDQNICYKRTRLYCSTYSYRNTFFNHCHGFSRINSETRTCFLEHQHSML